MVTSANYPDFTAYGYQVIELLQQNVYAGRITYKATNIVSQTMVVIKQFSFAKLSWDGYKEIEREIDVLKNLNHRGIPKFIGQFDPGNGLCLVQEYIDAPALSKRRSFSPEEIKSIAIQALEVLEYLQAQTPFVFHKDIKPENILVSEKRSLNDSIKVYIIDFGLARIGNHTMNASSQGGGTLGFMSPEQLHDQIQKCSDRENRTRFLTFRKYKY